MVREGTRAWNPPSIPGCVLVSVGSLWVKGGFCCKPILLHKLLTGSGSQLLQPCVFLGWVLVYIPSTTRGVSHYGLAIYNKKVS
jgi:hypothetical protein